MIYTEFSNALSQSVSTVGGGGGEEVRGRDLLFYLILIST